MTMFVRAIEGFVGRIVILLAICLTVLVAAFFIAAEAAEVDVSNQFDGLWFQIKLVFTNVVEFFHEIWLWSIGR